MQQGDSNLDVVAELGIDYVHRADLVGLAFVDNVTANWMHRDVDGLYGHRIILKSHTIRDIDRCVRHSASWSEL